MQTILDALIDAGIDTLKLIPFLFLTYLLMEFIENKTSKKTQKAIQKSGKFGSILGGIIGMFPQCGFSTMGANLYAARIITLGTLFSIFLSTSDEMLPILISEQRNVKEILIILGIKVVIVTVYIFKSGHYYSVFVGMINLFNSFFSDYFSQPYPFIYLKYTFRIEIIPAAVNRLKSGLLLSGVIHEIGLFLDYIPSSDFNAVITEIIIILIPFFPIKNTVFFCLIGIKGIP